MAKEIKFNIKLNIDGKQVVVDCKNNVKQLGEALTGVKAKAMAMDMALSRLASISTLMRNGMDGIRQLGDAHRPSEGAHQDRRRIHQGENPSTGNNRQRGQHERRTRQDGCWAGEEGSDGVREPPDCIGKAIAPYQEFINMFGQLGGAVSGVGQAEGFFVRNTKAVQDAMFARAEAAEAEMRKALEAESKVNCDRYPLKCIDTNHLHTRLFVTP